MQAERSPYPLLHAPLFYLLTQKTKFSPSAKYSSLHIVKHKSLTLSLNAVFSCIPSAFSISFNLHKNGHLTVFFSLQNVLVSMFSCDPAARKVSNPVPNSEMRKLTSREAKTGLVRDEGNKWLTAAFCNVDVGLSMGYLVPKSCTEPWTPA